MKTYFNFALLLLFSNSMFCQFQFEGSYSAKNINRFLMQDDTERYTYFDEDSWSVKISNGDHQLIDSISVPPCEGIFSYRLLRNDFEGFGLGVFVNCRDSNNVYSEYLVNNEGNVVKEFNPFIQLVDNYIVEFEEENFQTNIYDSRSLQLLKELPEINLRKGNTLLLEKSRYIGHNGTDSIFVYDEMLELEFSIPYDFINKNNSIEITAVSVIENSAEKFYFVVSEFTPYSNMRLYTQLIDQNGLLLKDFSDNPVIHKEGELFQLVFTSTENKISRYVVKDREEYLIIEYEGINNPIYFKSNGKYLIYRYIQEEGLVVFYGLSGEIEHQFYLDQPSAIYPYLNLFEDDYGNEFFIYTQDDDIVSGQINTTILKDWEYLQTIDDSFGVRLSNLTGFDTKLISLYSFEFDFIRVFGYLSVNSKEIKAKTIKLFPNPLYEKLNVASDILYESYRVYSSTSKEMMSGEVNSREFSIDLSGLFPGIYFISMSNSNEKPLVRKIIKVKP